MASIHDNSESKIEIVNGRPRLKGNPKPSTASMKKSLSFHHGERTQEQGKKPIGFNMIIKRFLKESSPDLPKI